MYTEEKIQSALVSMQKLLQAFVEKLKNSNINGKNEVKLATLNEPFLANDIPQDFHFVEYQKRQVFIQMLKPVLAPCFYFIKDDIHVFTSDIEEAYSFLTEPPKQIEA